MAITINGDTYSGTSGTAFTIPSNVAIFVVPGTNTLDYDATRRNIMSMYGYDPLGTTSVNPNATPGSAEYAMSQTYYSANPSSRYIDLVNQYSQQHYSVVGSSGVLTPAQQATFQTYNTPDTESMVAQKAQNLGLSLFVGASSAAVSSGIAELSRQYGYTTQSLGNIATGAYSAVESLLSSSKTQSSLTSSSGGADYSSLFVTGTGDKISVYEYDLKSAVLDYISPSIEKGTTIYVPFGSYAQTKIENAKLGIDVSTGELAIYQENYHGQWTLIGGAGRYGLQSGMFSLDALTAAIYTQESGSRTFASGVDVSKALDILNNKESYSRLGSEAYGGYVSPLDSRTLTQNSVISRYADTGNLANLTLSGSSNFTKTESPGADIPWAISESSPVFSYMTDKGIGGAINIQNVTRSFTTLMSTQLAASEPTIVYKSDVTGLPAPFISTPLGGSTKMNLGTLNGLNIVSATLTGSVDIFGSLVPGSYSLKTTTTPSSAETGFLGDLSNAFKDALQTEFINPINSIIGTNFNIQPDYGSTTYEESYKATLSSPFVSNAPSEYKASQITFDITSSKTIQNQTGIQSVSSYLGSQLPEWNYDPTPVKQSGNFFINGETGGFGIGSDYTNAFVGNALQSMYSSFKENPIQFGANTGFWAGVTIATMGIGDIVAASAAGGSRIAQTALSLSPYVKSALAIGYGAEAIWVTTNGLTTTNPSQMGSNFGPFAESSIVPMIIGGSIGQSLYNFDVRNIGASARNIYEATNFPNTPSLDDIGAGISESSFGIRQRVAGIKNIGVNSGSPYYTENGNFYPMEPSFGRPFTSSPSGTGGANMGLPNLNSPIAGLLPDLLVKGYSFGSNPSVIERAFEGTYSFTPEQNKFIVEQMVIKDIGYSKGYGINTIFDRADAMSPESKELYQGIKNTMSIQDQITGSAYVRSQIPEYPLLESPSIIFARRAQKLISNISDITTKTESSSSFWDWQETKGKYGSPLQISATEYSDTLTAWRNRELPYYAIKSSLEESAAAERGFGKFQEQGISIRSSLGIKPYKSATPVLTSTKIEKEFNLPSVISGGNPPTPSYDTYIEKYGHEGTIKSPTTFAIENEPQKTWGNIMYSRSSSPLDAVNIKPQMELETNLETNPYRIHGLKYAEASPRKPLNIKTESDVRSKFMEGWNEGFRKPGTLTIWRNGNARYSDVDRISLTISPSANVFSRGSVSTGISTIIIGATSLDLSGETERSTDIITPIYIQSTTKPDRNIIPISQPFSNPYTPNDTKRGDTYYVPPPPSTPKIGGIPGIFPGGGIGNGVTKKRFKSFYELYHVGDFENMAGGIFGGGKSTRGRRKVNTRKLKIGRIKI